jgi:hypothetical protein
LQIDPLSNCEQFKQPRKVVAVTEQEQLRSLDRAANR